MSKKETLDIGLKELAFLAALLDGETLLGIEDPFEGWLAHQVEEEWERLSPEMEANNLITIRPENEIMVDAKIEQIIKTCCFPDTCIILTIWKATEKVSNYAYYLTPGVVIEKADLVPSESCRLSVLTEPFMVIDKLIDLLSPSKDLAENSGGGSVPASVISEIKDNNCDYQKALVYLDEKCQSFDDSELFIKDLLNPTAYSIVIVTSLDENDYKTTGFSLLEGKEMLWRMRPYAKGDEEWVEISACSQDDVEEDINKIGVKLKKHNA